MTTKRWNTLEHLYDEEEISDYLNAALLAIEEGEADVRYFFRCLTKAAQARAINQIAKDTGIDRQALCGVFLDDVDGNDNADVQTLQENTDSILKAAKAYAVYALA
jgi:probable addiction module antidote protein